MAYGIGHLSSTTRGKCILCGKSTSTFVSLSNYSKDEKTKLGTYINIPVCDGEHYNTVAKQKDILIGHAKTINSMLKNINKQSND